MCWVVRELRSSACIRRMYFSHCIMVVRDSIVIERSCKLASRSLVEMMYTTMHSSIYCSPFSCRCFISTRCPAPSQHEKLCQKLHFVASVIPRLGAFLYMDSDLIVTRLEFFSALQAIANNHDWVAVYDLQARQKPLSYNETLTSLIGTSRDSTNTK